MSHQYTYRDKEITDDPWITEIASKLWGSVDIISKNHIYNLLHIPNIIAVSEGTPVGWISYGIENDACEIVALYTSIENQGIGTALIELVYAKAKEQGCHTMWLLTTNDNTQALRFYQKRGFLISAVRINEIAKQRKTKPIPMTGNDGIPIRDEIKLQRILT